MVNNCIVKSIVISENGVKYISLFKNYEMTWEEIKVIGITYIPARGSGRPPWLYLAADLLPNTKSINKRYFLIHYRKDVEQAIRMYWDKEIWGIGSVNDS